MAKNAVPASVVARLLVGLPGRGVNVTALLAGAGIDPGIPRMPDSVVSITDFTKLLRRAAILSGDELWGLRPVKIRPGTLFLACQLALGGATVEQALRAVLKFYYAIADDFRLRLAYHGGSARLIVVDHLVDYPGRDMLHGIIVTTLFAALQWLSGQREVFESVTLCFPELPDTEKLAAYLGVPLQTGAPHTSIAISRALLSRPIVAGRADIGGFVASLPRIFSLSYQERLSVAQRAAGYLCGPGGWNAGCVETASALAMSTETFRRRLHVETEMGFWQLRDSLRRAEAMALLEIQQINLDHLARILGFSELSTFHRAFKRWTGEPPGHYRQHLHANRDTRHNEAAHSHID